MKPKASTGVFIITLIGIFVLINVVSARIFGRLDLTEDDMYSLSEASMNLMKQLDDEVFAKAYFTADLPSPYNSHTRFVRDLFEEYQAYSKGRFRFEFIDPGEEDKVRNDLMLLGVPPVQIQEIQNDKFQVKQAYLGIVFYYGDKKEVIPVVKGTQGLEYEVTSTIRKLTAERLKVIGFLQGHDEPKPKEAMKRIVEHLEKNYKVNEVNIAESKGAALDDVDSLVIINPQSKISEEEIFHIDQFMMKGKTIAFFVDNVKVDLKQFQATNLDTGLAGLLKHYGITINNDLVLDLQNKRINIATQQGMYRISNIVNYPLIPVVTDFDKENPLTGKLDSLSFPFISSLTVTADTAETEYSVLARSSERSWLQTGMYKLNPMESIMPGANDKMGPFPLMAMAKGRFDSYFNDKLDEGYADKPYLANPDAVIRKSPETRILVSGDGTFTLDEFFDPMNAIFFADSIDWLMQDNALISIRGRGLSNKPLAELEPWEKNLLKYMNIIGIPIIFIIFGIIRWSMRKARQRGFQLASK